LPLLPSAPAVNSAISQPTISCASRCASVYSGRFWQRPRRFCRPPQYAPPQFAAYFSQARPEIKPAALLLFLSAGCSDRRRGLAPPAFSYPRGHCSCARFYQLNSAGGGAAEKAVRQRNFGGKEK